MVTLHIRWPNSRNEMDTSELWANFVQYTSSEFYKHEAMNLPRYDQYVYGILETCGGSYRVEDLNHYIDFENDRDASQFVLRWS